MSNQWDEFSKSLAEKSVPRRESLRLLGATLAGAVLSPFGLGGAFAGQSDPCKTYCKCRNKSQQSQCLAECRECNSDPRFLCGSCSGGYVCADLTSDPWNCGACGFACAAPGPYECGACINGRCEYACVEGAERCNGICTFLSLDPNNCGACGNVCDGPNPSCYGGVCGHCTPYCPERWCGGNGCGGECVCPSGTYCEYNGYCYDICSPGLTWCDPGCVDLSSDPFNCGSCYHQCAPSEFCAGGICQGL